MLTLFSDTTIIQRKKKNTRVSISDAEMDTPASSTTKTGRHDIAEILLKVVLNTKNQIKSNQILIVENRNVDSLVVFVFLSRFKNFFFFFLNV
jgi:hypothetical protein